MSKWLKYIIVGLLCMLLMLVRAFENELFYDPFIAFFKHDLFTSGVPEYQGFKLFLSHLFRYGLNTLISLMILYVAFENWHVVKFSGLLYLIAFILLASVYFYLIANALESGYLMTFYVRRFLIQPLFILLLLPAFYYQREVKEKVS